MSELCLDYTGYYAEGARCEQCGVPCRQHPSAAPAPATRKRDRLIDDLAAQIQMAHTIVRESARRLDALEASFFEVVEVIR